MMTCFEFQSSIRGFQSIWMPFIGETHTYMLTIHQRTLCVRCTACSHAHHILNFCEENYHDQKSNHKIHENIMPQKFGTIRYIIVIDHVHARVKYG